jgi:hypothetical protein
MLATMGQVLRTLTFCPPSSKLTVEWEEEFSPCPAFKGLLEHLAANPRPPSLSEFISAPYWEAARLMARSALKQAGLDPWPLHGRISFADYVEVHDLTPRCCWNPGDA